MDVENFFEEMPFAKMLGIELTEVEDGHAEGQIEMRPDLSWSTENSVAHGGVTFTLADTVGGAALVSLFDQPVATVDMRIDYLEAGTGDLYATADGHRLDDEVGTVDVVVTDSKESEIASIKGTYVPW